MEKEIIYGVDLSKKITPLIVRDAILICFKEAHREVLDLMDEYAKWKSEEEEKKFKNMEIELMIKMAFKETWGDYDHPSKTDLIKVIDYLAQIAAQFREPEIIEKHYNEIKRLIDKL